VTKINNYLNRLADITRKFHYYCPRSPSVRLFTSAWNAEAVPLGEHLSLSSAADNFRGTWVSRIGGYLNGYL